MKYILKLFVCFIFIVACKCNTTKIRLPVHLSTNQKNSYGAVAISSTGSGAVISIGSGNKVCINHTTALVDQRKKGINTLDHSTLNRPNNVTPDGPSITITSTESGGIVIVGANNTIYSSQIVTQQNVILKKEKKKKRKEKRKDDKKKKEEKERLAEEKRKKAAEKAAAEKAAAEKAAAEKAAAEKAAAEKAAEKAAAEKRAAAEKKRKEEERKRLEKERIAEEKRKKALQQNIYAKIKVGKDMLKKLDFPKCQELINKLAKKIEKKDNKDIDTTIMKETHKNAVTGTANLNELQDSLCRVKELTERGDQTEASLASIEQRVTLINKEIEKKKEQENIHSLIEDLSKILKIKKKEK